MLKKVLLGLFVLLLVAQLVRPARNSGAIDGPAFIGRQHPVPAEVEAVLAKACYDCHSNQTRYPWYAEVQPVGWWLAWHVNDGKKHLNFSEFGSYAAKRQAKKLKEVAEEVADNGMPLPSYTWTHRDAVLTDAEKKLLTDWVRGAGGHN
ncbi:MAG: heme-binding domain-containing protein [Opitutae bacterium]|nr:heme-binding domain-containing protein [Opitutae bacterium]